MALAACLCADRPWLQCRKHAARSPCKIQFPCARPCPNVLARSPARQIARAGIDLNKSVRQQRKWQQQGGTTSSNLLWELELAASGAGQEARLAKTEEAAVSCARAALDKESARKVADVGVNKGRRLVK